MTQKLTERINFRVSRTERADFEQLYLTWRKQRMAQEGGRHEQSPTYSRAIYARELFRATMRSVLQLRAASQPSGGAA